MTGSPLLSGPRVLVLRALGLGDLLTVVPALRALRRAHPRARIELATPDGLGVLAHATGAVDRVVAHERLDDPLPAETAHPSIAVNLHGSGPESARALAATNPDRLLSYRHPLVEETADGPEWREDEHEVRRWCSMLEWYGIATDPSDLRLTPLPGSVRRDDTCTVVHPGAAYAARRWPADRFAAVARAERDAGRRVVVTGNLSERPLTGVVVEAAGLPPAANLAGRLDVAGLGRLVGGAGLVVCGDTGVAHLATALGTPSVVVFGPTPPSRWGPPDVGRHQVLWAGATGDPHGDRPFTGLLAVGVHDVLEAISRARGAGVETVTPPSAVGATVRV